MAAKDPFITPLVAEGLSLVAQIDAEKLLRDAKALELKPFDEKLKALNEELEKVKAALIELGAGPYGDGTGQTCRVVAGVDPQLSPDQFHLPEGTEDKARELAGDFFLKMFTRRVVLEPKPGFDAIADALLTPAKARNLVALCIIPGQLTGGRKCSIRWGK